MQFAMQDIRKWGFIKLGQKFLPNGETKDMFFDGLLDIQRDLCDIRCSAYSLTKRWDIVKSICEKEYVGVRHLVYLCEPMINNVTNISACQRKFRDKWDSMWNEVCETFGLSPWHRSILSDIGIRLAFSSEECIKSVYKEYLEFYNSVMCWFVFASSEQNLVKVAGSALQFVEFLVTQTPDEFNDCLNVWI